MKDRIKNLISIILPLFSIFIIAITLKSQPTGFAVYEGKEIYRLNGSINISLEESIPMDSYMRIKIDGYSIKMNLIEFLGKAGKNYKIHNGYIVANNITYDVDFTSLGIIQDFGKGKHKIRVEIIHKDSLLYANEKIVEI